MKRRRFKSIVTGGGIVAIAVMFLLLLTNRSFQPEVPEMKAPPPAVPAPPIDSLPVAGDTGDPVAAIPAPPDHTAVPDAADSLFAADTVERIVQGPDTAVIPADVESLLPIGKLIVPVAGIKPGQLQNTYNDSRSEGRVHNAIDIMAPAGTPVLAVTEGKIVKLFISDRGGITIYQLDPNGRVIYYYAHLERYADGLVEGATVRQGDVIAYVGDSGNAGPGNYHLHFGISIVDDPRQYWGGVPVNPYPILRGGRGEG
jgi:peptidoglycan LD-endopeptidase LytH